MIITDSFLHIANPRSGSTFSRKAILHAFNLAKQNGIKHPKTLTELVLPNLRGVNAAEKDHHGTVAQIPKSASALPIFSSVRHPVSLAASTFALGLWARRQQLEKLVPNIVVPPDWPILFLEYLDTTMPARWGISRQSHGLGYFTAHFITMFSIRPTAVFEEASTGRSVVAAMEETIPAVRFHRQEYLAADLESSLRTWVGEEISLAATRLAPTNVSDQARVGKAKQSKGFRSAVLRNENQLLEFYERRGIDYSDIGSSTLV